MSKIHILNGAQPYEFAPGKLNKTLAERAKATLEAQGHEVRLTTVAAGYDVQDEVEIHLGGCGPSAIPGKLDGCAVVLQEIHG
ncbi:hypothetical protein [Roseivivax marinus]|uniref:hypothetical protein n=1 Tax=Roseivivax marinus TaxID=1379903 RepID=UPI002740032D|nr:hypothetical protein [Roseivivax marinus]